MSFVQYSGPMCRAKSNGGRRCPKCGSYSAAANANANRRLGREARKKVVAHLKEQGLVETAAAVQAAPPSMLPELMAGLGIDKSVLGSTPMPSAHANPPSAKLLIAQAKKEQQKLLGPQLSDAQIALDEAQKRDAAAELAVDDARKAVNRERARLRKATKELEAGTGSAADVAEREKALADAKAAHAAAKVDREHAADDLVAARFGTRVDLDQAGSDRMCAELTDADVEAIARSHNRRFAGEATDALQGTGSLSLAGRERDTSVYSAAKIPVDTGDGITEVEGRLLDGGTGIYRRGPSDFLIVQRKGDAYYPVASASSKQQALAKANRIPVMTTVEALPDGATDMQRQAHAVKSDLALEVARKAADGSASNSVQHQQIIDKGMDGAHTKLVEAVGAGPVRADIYDGVKRHKKALREKAAVEAGRAAHEKVIAEGGSKQQADAAYAAAHRRALGTPTRGGGVIPHFEHKIPPESLGADKHAALTRSGIRAFGVETAGDYDVIAQRAGDLKKWGFANSSGTLQVSSIESLTASNSEFVKKHLGSKERAALTTYTGGSYRQINAAITGRDATPPPSIKSTVSQLESAFDKFNEHNPNQQPMTVMRGTKVPSGWKGTAGEYIDQAFSVGSKVQIGKVTSCSTRETVAHGFAGHPPYMMVIRTRNGIPVKSISQFSGEDEVVVPPGTDLRCVKIDHNGLGGKPTVYLVAEDLVAESETAPTPIGNAA